MTEVLVQLRRPAQDGTDVPTQGTLECRPIKRRVVGATVVVPGAFTVKLVDGDATLDLAATGPDWCWRIIERVPGGTERHVAVPADDAAIGYEDLVDVDPETLDPTAEPEATWWVALNAIGEGPQGPAGPEGPTGPAGADGAPGTAGADGQDGLDAALPAETRTAPLATTPTLDLQYASPVDDPDLFQITYRPPGGIAEALAAILQATFIINERGLFRTQMAPDQPDDIGFKSFGNPATGTFTADIFRAIPNRLNQGVWVFGIKPDGRIDNTRYPWTGIDVTGSTGGKYQLPSGTTYWPGSVRRVASDKVEMRGSIDIPGAAIAAGDVIGAVPAEFIPARKARVLASAGDGAQSVRVDVMTDGTLVARTPRASAAGYISFDGSSYTL